MRLRRGIALFATTLMIGLAACGGGADNGTDSDVADEDVTLTYWASNQGNSLEDDKEILAPVLKEFTDETGIKVDLEVVGWSDLQTRIQTAITSGQGPDVLNIGNTWGVSLQATGGLMEFGDEEMEAIGGADKFVQSALATGGAVGTDPASVPLYGLAYGLYYNKAMFNEAGLEPPTTWEEMVSVAEKFTNPDEGVYGMSLAAGSYTENAHFAFINGSQNGAELFDADGNPTFTEDGIVDGILRYLDLMQSDKVVNISDAQFRSGTESVAVFARDKAAMILNQNNANVTIEANGMKPEEFGVVPYPAPAGAPEDTASHVAGINLAIMKSTPYKSQALEFVKYMTSKDVQADLGKPYSAIPILVDGEPTFTTDPQQLEVFTTVFNELSKPLPLVPNEDQFETNVGQAMNKMFADIATGGTVTRDEVKSAMQTAQNAIR